MIVVPHEQPWLEQTGGVGVHCDVSAAQEYLTAMVRLADLEHDRSPEVVQAFRDVIEARKKFEAHLAKMDHNTTKTGFR